MGCSAYQDFNTRSNNEEARQRRPPWNLNMNKNRPNTQFQSHGLSRDVRPARLPPSGSVLDSLQLPHQAAQLAFASAASPQKPLQKPPRVDQDVINQVPCSCPHTKQYSPVCSRNNQTYYNRAIMDCFQTCGFDVQFGRAGPCNQVAGRGVLF